MGRSKKKALPFDKEGGVIAIQRVLLSSDNYESLRAQSKVLITLLHIHWRNEKTVDYGIREASQKIPCDRRTAIRAFNELQERGFITCAEHSMFSSRTQSKSRSWRLNWLPFNDHPPSNEWKKWAGDN